MILVDTSVWIDHLRRADHRLVRLLDADEVLQHPYVLGEIALGNLRNRGRVLGAIAALLTVTIASHEEVMLFIESRGLHGRGIGLVDAHLLASAQLTPGCSFWTRDRRLRAVAAEVGVTTSEL